MADNVSVVLGVVQIVVQIVAAYMAYVIYKYNRLSKAWLAVTVALVLMTVRRITALSIELGAFSQLTGTIAFVDRIFLPFMISVFLFLGLWDMKKRFETFEITERTVKQKIKFFGRPGKEK